MTAVRNEKETGTGHRGLNDRLLRTEHMRKSKKVLSL